MDHIETAILNCYGIREAEQNMVFAARLTQHGHTIQSMADLMDLYHQSYSQKTVEKHCGASTSNRTEIHGHYRGCCGCKQTLPCTDHKTSERSKVHECISAVQQLFRSRCICYSIWNHESR